jgi:hypothetical protein
MEITGSLLFSNPATETSTEPVESDLYPHTQIP